MLREPRLKYVQCQLASHSTKKLNASRWCTTSTCVLLSASVSREASLHKHSEPSATKQCVATVVPSGHLQQGPTAALHKRLRRMTSAKSLLFWNIYEFSTMFTCYMILLIF